MHHILHAAFSSAATACSKDTTALCGNTADAPSTLIFFTLKTYLTAHAVPDNVIDGTKMIAPAIIVMSLLVPGGCTSPHLASLGPQCCAPRI